MQVGYNVRQPDGRTYKMLEEPKENRQPQVEGLLSRWSDYCNQNWISPNSDDPYSPENKVKAFLGSLAYFLIQGDTEGIVTDYKEMANGKREIPMSSCPSYIEDQLYSSASVPGTDQRRDENEVFHEMMRDIDERTAKIKKPAPKRRKALPTVYDKIQLIRERFGRDIKFVHIPVDTEGVFLYGGETWRVNEPQYQATSSKDGEQVYGMDTVICASGLLGLYFFDMNYEQIMPQKIM